MTFLYKIKSGDNGGNKTMTRIFLILIMFIQLSGCAVVLETAAGSFIGGLAVEVVKDKLDKADKAEKDADKKDAYPKE